jgi:hypothetical protein
MNYIIKNKLKTKPIVKEINQKNSIATQKISCPSVNE